MKQKIAILGSGPSGLVSTKFALDYNFTPVVFEKNSEIGGVWNQRDGFTWNSMKTNISKYSCMFSHFPWKANSDDFPSTSDMFQYLKNYANSFGINEYIKFDTTVSKIEKSDSDWSVSWQQNGKTYTEVFKYVIVATGVFSQKYIPEIPRAADSEVTIIHSGDYKSSAYFTGKKILVVGGSLTSVELAADIAKNEEIDVSHSFRKPFWVLKKFISSPDSAAKKPMDLVFYNRKFYNSNGVFSQQEVCIKKNSYMESLCKDQQDVESLFISPKGFYQPINISISDDYVEQVKKGKIKTIKSQIQKITEKGVIFEDGTEKEVDVVIMSTGYKTDLRYLSDTIKSTTKYDQDNQLQPLILSKATMHKDLPNLFFVGMYKGPYFGVIEMQAKWAVRSFAGQVELPDDLEYQKDIEEEMKIREADPKPQFPHPDYVRFADSIASRAGENFDLDKLKTYNPELYEKFLSTPMLPGHFSTEPNDVEHYSQIVGDILSTYEDT